MSNQLRDRYLDDIVIFILSLMNDYYTVLKDFDEYAFMKKSLLE